VTNKTPTEILLTQKILVFWLPVFVYCSIIFCFSSLESHQVPIKKPGFDKFAHFFEYAPLGFLIIRALFVSLKGIKRFNIFVFATLLTCLYGLSDEWHQMFVPGRHASFLDIIADTCGGALGAAIFCMKNKNRKAYVKN